MKYVYILEGSEDGILGVYTSIDKAYNAANYAQVERCYFNDRSKEYVKKALKDCNIMWLSIASRDSWLTITRELLNA